MSYELLDHTADAKFRAYGATKEEAFASAVEAMTAICADPSKLAHDQSFRITVRAKTLQSLLFDLLDEVLFLRDTEHFAPAIAEKLTITEQKGLFVLDATLRGDDARKWPGNLKAVTYSDMLVEERPDKTWLLQVVIDI